MLYVQRRSMSINSETQRLDGTGRHTRFYSMALKAQSRTRLYVIRVSKSYLKINARVPLKTSPQPTQNINTQLKTYHHAPSGIRANDPNVQTAKDSTRLRTRRHCYQPDNRLCATDAPLLRRGEEVWGRSFWPRK